MKFNNEIVELLGYQIQVRIDQICGFQKKLLINTINPHSYYVAKKDIVFSNALKTSDILIPDGIGIVFATKVITGKKIKRITGADLHKHLLELANRQYGKVFYLGSQDTTLINIRQRLLIEYPNIQFESYSPPFVKEFSLEENQKIVKHINVFKPHILFVGLTAPKQEKWANQHKELLDAKIIASIGAVFDFYAGTIKRPGSFWQKYGLEWLPRLIHEPNRLWRRTFISTPCFIWDVFKDKFYDK